MEIYFWSIQNRILKQETERTEKLKGEMINNEFQIKYDIIIPQFCSFFWIETSINTQPFTTTHIIWDRKHKNIQITALLPITIWNYTEWNASNASFNLIAYFYSSGRTHVLPRTEWFSFCSIHLEQSHAFRWINSSKK